MNLLKPNKSSINPFFKEIKTRLHKDDAEEYKLISDYAQRINQEFKLFNGTIQVNPIQTEKLWGLCEPDEGRIHILFRWPREDYRIERRTLIRVLCHEMTHFRILGHKAEFFNFCNENLIEFMRREANDPKIKYERFVNEGCATYGF